MNKEAEKLKQDIEAYKQSEQEASEIIAELKHTLDCKNGTIETLKAENDRLKEEIGGMQILIDNYITHTEKYHQTLQEIKELARGLINGSIGGCEDDIGYMLQDIITKAEEE